MRKILTTSSLIAFVFLFIAVPDVSAHSCQNTNKEEGAGQEAIENNGGVAGFIERQDGEEVFIHPSISQHEFLSSEFEGAPGKFEGYEDGHEGSLPSGAHDSDGWTEVPFGS